MKPLLIVLIVCSSVMMVPEVAQTQDLPPTAKDNQFEVKQDDSGVTVNLNGELMTRYLVKSGAKPVLYPIIGPDGVAMTRCYPVADTTLEESQDHPHHRSFWFTHGDVNGVSFWHEVEAHGEVQHDEFLEVSGGDTAVIATRNHWIHPNTEAVLCSDMRKLTFGTDGEVRWIDFDIEIVAGDEPVTFGDTKEGMFGIRVAESMKVDAGLGGCIVNSHGQTNKETWGRPAEWVDYYGPIAPATTKNKKTADRSSNIYGIAILNHPDSFGFPSHWHVRSYGLFAANPFGLHDFLAESTSNLNTGTSAIATTKTAEAAPKKSIDGSVTLEPTESLKFRYRVLLHKGNAKQAQVAKHFSQYSGASD